jgi:hypothetical protein
MNGLNEADLGFARRRTRQSGGREHLPAGDHELPTA